MPRKPPEGYHTVTPYIIASDGAKLLEFVERAFGAEILHQQKTPGGMHAEFRIGDSRLMVGAYADGSGAMPATFYLYVDDADAAYQRALAAGAKSVEAPNEAEYGDRRAGVEDALGNKWYVAHRR